MRLSSPIIDPFLFPSRSLQHKSPHFSRSYWLHSFAPTPVPPPNIHILLLQLGPFNRHPTGLYKCEGWWSLLYVCRWSQPLVDFYHFMSGLICWRCRVDSLHTFHHLRLRARLVSPREVLVGTISLPIVISQQWSRVPGYSDQRFYHSWHSPWAAQSCSYGLPLMSEADLIFLPCDAGCGCRARN